jgi:hypothetical protein
MSISTTHLEGSANASSSMGPIQYAGHPLIEPADRDPEVSSTIDAAVEHFSPVNRHQRALIDLSLAPETAHAIYLVLSQVSADVLITQGRAEEIECVGCQVDSYAKHGLLERGDEAALMAAQTRASRWAFGFATAPTEDELALLHHDPQALVRAAYALARDLND